MRDMISKLLWWRPAKTIYSCTVRSGSIAFQGSGPEARCVEFVRRPGTMLRVIVQEVPATPK